MPILQLSRLQKEENLELFDVLYTVDIKPVLIILYMLLMFLMINIILINGIFPYYRVKKHGSSVQVME